MKLGAGACVGVFVCGVSAGAGVARAQEPPPSTGRITDVRTNPWESDAPPPATAATGGSDRLRLTIDFMTGYGFDGANATLGFERQGRVGYAIFTAFGKLSPRLSYRISMNPVNETEPLPGCGAPGYFYPNDPKALYGADTDVPCDPKNGNRRVDPYRGIALDVVPQQGSLREAFVDVNIVGGLTVRFGRMRLPIGFDWQLAGSFTAKDAPRIQRINAQNSYGVMASYFRTIDGRTRPLYSWHLVGFLGEGNRWWDYNYFYFENGSFDANTDMTMLVSGTFAPVEGLEVRGSFQIGNTGSKVERLPSYWASKRNDNSTIVGASYRPVRYVRLIAEHGRYTWGPTSSSAQMLGVDRKAIHKIGYYVTAEAWLPVTDDISAGGSVSREEIDRADSLVKHFADANLHEVVPGKKDRMTVLRLFANFGPRLRIGFYRTIDSNPFPWLSGMTPVEGPQAYSARNTSKWGFISRLRV